MSHEGSSLNEKRDLKVRNKHRKSLTSGALCRGFLSLKMCRLWVSSSPRDLQRWWWGYSNNKNRKRSELAKDRLSAKCFQFVSVFVYSWGDHGPFFQHCWIIVPYPEMARWQEDIWVGSFHIDLFVIHIPKKKETNMTRKIHHEWKCTSYSTWGLSNTSCYFLGVDIHRIAMYIFRPLNASDAFSTCIGRCLFFGTALHQVVNCLRVGRCVMSILVLEPGGNASARDFQVHRCKKLPISTRFRSTKKKHVEAYHVSVSFFNFWVCLERANN